MKRSRLNLYVTKWILLSVILSLFSFDKCETQISVPTLVFSNQQVQEVLKDVNLKSRRDNEVFLIYTSEKKKFGTITVLPIDSTSVTRFLKHKVGDIKGAAKYGNGWILVFDENYQKYFKKTKKMINLSFLSPYRDERNHVPVAIDAISYQYTVTDSGFVFKTARF